MADDPNRHSPGRAPIEPKNPERQPPDRREDDHVETAGHVERELPASTSSERATGEESNEGEGNKTADRQYRKRTEEFVKSGRVAAQAQKAAEALEGAEGRELRDAEEKGRRGRPK